MSLRKTIFGRQKSASSFNTEIGGVSSTLNTATLLASKLGISSSRIEDFTIVGADVKCNITGGSYAIPQSAFELNTDITFYKDNGSLVTTFTVDKQFQNATNLHTALFPGLVNITAGAFRSTTALKVTDFSSVIQVGNGSSFRFSGIEDIEFPLATSIISVNNFDGCTLLKNVSMPKVINIGGNRNFQNCSSLESVYVPKCSILGTTVGDDLNFINIKIGCTITVSDYLQTVNSGSPDGDLVYAITTRSCTVTYIIN